MVADFIDLSALRPRLRSCLTASGLAHLGWRLSRASTDGLSQRDAEAAYRSPDEDDWVWNVPVQEIDLRRAKPVVGRSVRGSRSSSGATILSLLYVVLGMTIMLCFAISRC